jgi:sialic acid synthase SpsE
MAMSTEGSPFASSFEIDGRSVGPDAPTYIIAEIGSNHNRDLELTKKLIDSAAKAGADAVKFQTLDYDKLFHDPTTDDEVAELYERIELPEDWHGELQEYAKKAGLTFFSSPTYPEAVDLLSDLGVPVYKVASAQVASDPNLIHRIATEGKPMIISTGLGGYTQVEQALRACLDAENREVAVLHCVSEYPTEANDAHLNRIRRLETAFGTVTGFSDHTASLHIPSAAVAVGADVIEKHITLDRDLEGPDHHYAREPDEFEEMVDGIREVELAMGLGVKLGATEEEKELRDKVRLKLVTEEDITEGTILNSDCVTLRRSPGGIPADLLDELEGNVRFLRDLRSGKLITWDCITGSNDD